MNVVTARADGQAGTLALAWSRRASHDHALSRAFFQKRSRSGPDRKDFLLIPGFAKTRFFLVRMETGNGTRNGGVDEVGLNQTFPSFRGHTFQSCSLDTGQGPGYRARPLLS